LLQSIDQGFRQNSKKTPALSGTFPFYNQNDKKPGELAKQYGRS
jgi:hypothetical protein